MSSIFIQIASYRDRELLPTLRDIVDKSSKNHQLTFGIVWQKDQTESIDEFAHQSNVRIIDCDWQNSKGLGWARSLTQSLYENEDFTLQLDSHHRFAQSWDEELIKMYNSLLPISQKPLLTSYAASYDANTNIILNNKPCKILPIDFKSSGTIWFNPVQITNGEELKRPIRARFVSGHYFFTTGLHCKEYIYDPNLYFAGDEIALSARSFTMGYDLYHPNINLVWHHYGRNDRIKHWGDHNSAHKEQGIIDKTWNERDIESKKRIRQLLGEEDYGIDLGIYGLGNQRTIQDYEKYGGFDFKNRRIQQSAIHGVEPPVSYDSEIEWNNGFRKIIPIKINQFDKEVFIKKIDTISLVKLDLISLHRKIIYSQMCGSHIFNNDSIDILCNSEHTPMKYIIYGLDSNLNVVHKYEKDLRHYIHWN